MAEERGGGTSPTEPGDPAPASAPDHLPAPTASPEIGPLSVPTRVIPSSDGKQGATMVALTRRRPRRRTGMGLRPPVTAPPPPAPTPGRAAAPTPDRTAPSATTDAPASPPVATATTPAAPPSAPAPEAESDRTRPTRRPDPDPAAPTATTAPATTPTATSTSTPTTAPPAAGGPPPSTGRPVPASPPAPGGEPQAPRAAADALPTQPVPQGLRGTPRMVGTTSGTVAGLPTERVVAQSSGDAKPSTPPAVPPPATPPPATPPAARGAAPVAASAAASVAAAAPPSPPPSRPATTGAPDGPASGPRRAAVDARDAEYAATSTVLASARTRIAGWRRGWTWHRAGRLVCAFVAVLVLLVTGLGWGATSWLQAAVRQIGALDPDSSAIRNAAAQQGDQNFLVVGSDTRIGAAASAEAGDSSDVPGARADTVMIVHVPEDRNGVTVVAFPRDLEVTRPECERWDSVTGRYTGDTIPRTPKVKLNTAYAAGGPRCVTKVVQELSGLAVNRFLGVDFQGFQGMVDAVGGVPVCVERPIRDSILGTVVPRKGTSTLSGQQALNFVRARHVVGDPSSDYGRIQRQQRFLSALLRTSLSTGTLFDPGRLRGLIDAVSRSTFGENIGSDQLVTLAQSLGNLDPRAVSFTTVPTTGQANSRGNEVLRASADRDLFAAIIDGRPLPGAAPAPRPAGGPAPGAPAPAPAAPMTPQQVRATLVDGRSADASSDDDAGTVSNELRRQGFSVVPDDRAARSETTTIRFSSDEAAAASLLARSVPGAVLDPSAPGRAVLTLTLGDDYDGRIISPADPGASRPVVPTITAADATCA